MSIQAATSNEKYVNVHNFKSTEVPAVWKLMMEQTLICASSITNIAFIKIQLSYIYLSDMIYIF